MSKILRKKLEYKKRLRLLSELFVEEMKQTNKVDKISMEYFDYHNNNCPGCSLPLPKEGGVISDFGVLGMILLGETGNETAYLYAICNTCTNLCVTEMQLDENQKSAKMLMFENNLELNISSNVK